MLQKVRVLGIAPYDSMKTTMIRIAKQFSRIELVDALVGDLEDGADIVKHYDESKYDVILSRGGTKLYIDEVAKKPVFEIPLTYPDLMGILKLVEGFSGKIVILCYPNISSDVKMVCELLERSYDIFTVHSWNDAREKVKSARDQGYQLIIGDAVSTSYAAEFGLQSMLLVSGPESIKTAFNDILRVYKYFDSINTEYQNMKSFLLSAPSYDFSMNAGGEIIYSAKRIPDRITNACRELLPMLSDRKALEKSMSQKKVGKEMFFIRSVRAKMPSPVWYFSVNVSISETGRHTRFHGMDVFSQEDLTIYAKQKESVHSGGFLGNVAAATLSKHSDIVHSSMPILVTGEKGTEKTIIAHQIFLTASGKRDLLYQISGRDLSAKLMDYLFYSVHSPLFSLNTCVLFKEMQYLSDNVFGDFLEQLAQILPNVTCRVLLTYEYNHFEHTHNVDEMRINRIKNRLKCKEIRISPLRNNITNIANYALLYIHEQNQLNGTNIIGLEPEAMELLESYSWPNNTNELERILNEAIKTARSPWLTGRRIREILREEGTRRESTGGLAGGDIDLSQTLEKIEYGIIRKVLEEENMNQARTAKRLGIGRSTLWRILKKDF